MESLQRHLRRHLPPQVRPLHIELLPTDGRRLPLGRRRHIRGRPGLLGDLEIPSLFLGPGVAIGPRTLIHPGAVIGADGFGLAMDSGRWRKVPQLGSVRIGADCEIGANTTIDRGAIDDTVLGDDVRLDNQVQVAHNVVIGDHSAIAGCVGIAGSTRIGRYCMIAGASGIGGHLEICDHVVITAMSTVLDSIDTPGAYGSAVPARPLRSWQRTLVRLGQLDRLFKRRADKP